jgi:hypothetical protein
MCCVRRMDPLDLGLKTRGIGIVRRGIVIGSRQTATPAGRLGGRTHLNSTYLKVP